MSPASETDIMSTEVDERVSKPMAKGTASQTDTAGSTTDAKTQFGTHNPQQALEDKHTVSTATHAGALPVIRVVSEDRYNSKLSEGGRCAPAQKPTGRCRRLTTQPHQRVDGNRQGLALQETVQGP